MTALHKPVLLDEAIAALDAQKDGTYLDATFGRGGHTKKILSRGGKVIAFDSDQEAVNFGTNEFQQEIKSGQLTLIHNNFEYIQKELTQRSISQVDGILFDLGTSVDQLKSKDRGFSFETDSELDMRMDTNRGVQAKDLLAILPEKQLMELFREYGGEENARAVAKRIVKAREQAPITRTQQLADLIWQTKGGRHGKLHPATKVFQALRIAVNTEFEALESALPQAYELLKSEGKIVVISFHEGEDRIVKKNFQQWQAENKGEAEQKKPVTPSEQELEENPRSRSAKLRSFIKRNL